MIILRLKAPNDSNGNPRRVELLLNEAGEVVSARDEGYAGRAKLTPGKVRGPEIEVPAREYTRWLVWKPGSPLKGD